MEKLDKIKQGKKNRIKGKKFEKEVQKDLESKGWIVMRFTKNVDLKANKLVDVKPKFNPYTKSLMMNSGGFVDFICLKKVQNYIVLESENDSRYPTSSTKLLNDYSRTAYEVIGVECKIRGYLDREEKEKIRWLLDNNIFSRILIAKKDERSITYKECD